MTYVEFCYWLQGFFELANPSSLTDEQVKTINNHLNMAMAYEKSRDYNPQVEAVAPRPVPRPSRTGGNPDSVMIKC
jgi:hypothetical protein